MRTRLKWIAVTTGLCVIAALVAMSVRGRHRNNTQPVAAAFARSEYTPELDVVRYKFVTTSTPGSEIASTIRALEERRKVSAESPFDLSDLAEQYFRRASITGAPEDYKASEAMARRSVAILPYPNPAPLTLAKLANAKHEFREAIQIAQDFSSNKPSAAAQIIMASAHLALGELDRAVAAAEAAVSLRPDNSGYLMRALVLQAQGRDAEAAFDFTRAASLEVTGDLLEAARLRTLWGRFLLRRGELAGAAALFDEALRIVPDHPLALAQKAELALRTGKTKDSRVLFEQAFAASRQVRYLIDLARAQELSGDPSGADRTRDQVERLIRAELAEHGVGHKLDLVEVLVDRGTPADLVEAVVLGREELVHRPSADTRFQLARALFRSGGARDEAIAQVRAALASGARDARFYELAARLEEGPRQALYTREAEKLDPGGSGWRSLGMETRSPVARSN